VSAIAFALAHSAFKQMLPSSNVSSIGSKHCIHLIIITVQYAPTSSASRHFAKADDWVRTWTTFISTK
jgi:hypothetical protein